LTASLFYSEHLELAVEVTMLTFKEELFILLHYSSKKEALVELNPSTSELIAFGGILVELMLAGRVRLDENQLVVTDTSTLGDAILDEALTRLAPSQPIKLTEIDWIVSIATKLPMGHQVFAGLLDKGILRREEERTMFGLSRSTIYPLAAGVIQQLTERQLNVMVHNAKPDPHTAALLFMVSVWGGSGMLGKLTGKEKKVYQKRWDDLFSDYWGEYPVDHEMEPIEGLDPAVRKAIGSVAVSWVSAQASYVADDFSLWRHISKIDVL
jgi:hypothetical protein